jgi:HD-like signal output (HDOD) protein
LNYPDLEELVASTDQIAMLPGTVVELLYLLNDATTCADKVKTIIERDPAMTVNILKLGNSSFYGVPREITCVREALVLLGNRCVAALSFATGMAPILRRNLDGYGLTRDQFWNHSLISGAASSEAMRISTGPDLCCEAFTAGLVHDIGMLVIDPWLHRNGIRLEPSGPMFNVCQLERENLGFDHSQAGAMLARKWGFPSALSDPIAHHHEKSFAGPHTNLIRCVAAGNVIAEALDSGISSQACSEVGESLTELGFSSNLLENVTLDLTTNLEETLVRATSSLPLAAK